MSDELPACGFVPVGWSEFEVLGVSQRATARAAVAVEIVKSSSGMMPAGLIGGEFIPHGGPLSFVEIANTGSITNGTSPGCDSAIRRLYVTGIPAEFVARIAYGMRSVSTDIDWACGVYRVATGGYDEVESNPITFERLGGFLRVALSALAFGETLDEGTARSLIEQWV